MQRPVIIVMENTVNKEEQQQTQQITSVSASNHPLNLGIYVCQSYLFFIAVNNMRMKLDERINEVFIYIK